MTKYKPLNESQIIFKEDTPLSAEILLVPVQNRPIWARLSNLLANFVASMIYISQYSSKNS